jgi:translocation protein SEC63
LIVLGAVGTLFAVPGAPAHAAQGLGRKSQPASLPHYPLQYHPDKNPDPKAHQYFATYVAKAYKALTDEVSRENYKKYGHPDGPQAMSGQSVLLLVVLVLLWFNSLLSFAALLLNTLPSTLTHAVSVALPEWFFSKDKQTAPLILLVLLFGGIVAPLGIAAWYLMGTQK